jgi:type III secretion system YopN/LcrE/InvE/MxiC family regulator
MSVNINNLSASNFGQAVGNNSSNSGSTIGKSYEGQQVQQPSEMEKIADSAEEMPAHLSEKVSDREKESKHLESRKLVPTGQTEEGGIKGKEASNALEKYANKLPDLNLARLGQLLQVFKKLQERGNSNSQELLDETKTFFEDVSHQKAALECAKELFAADPNATEMLQALNEADQQLMKESGPEVLAGLNVTTTAVEFAEGTLKGVATPEMLRDFYREAVLGHKNIATMHRAVLKKFGSASFAQALEFLMRSIGKDMDAKAGSTSEGSSSSPEKLQSTRDDMYFITTLKTTREHVSKLLQKMKEEWSLDPQSDEFYLIDTVLNLTQEGFIQMDQIATIAETFGLNKDNPEQIKPTIHFMNAVLNTVIRPIPIKAYPTIENQQKLISTTLEFLEELNQIEEAQE